MAPSDQDVAQVAVVSGASGFIATELVKQLLSKGYTVRGTVRDPKNQEKVGHLTALGEALPGNLTLHKADLLEEGSFDAVVEGADLVFHTASPFRTKWEDPYKELVEPALKGTKNVLNAAVKAKSVKRVVLTSSFAAAMKQKKGPANGSVYTEEDWDDETTTADGYRNSKTQAERAAWELAKSSGLDLVTIMPTFVLGPVVSRRSDATSIQQVTGFIEGTVEELMPWVCDVRDVARGHILAAEIKQAKGRYLICQSHTVNARELADALRERFPHLTFPDGTDTRRKHVIDNSKVQKELGLQITPVRESIVDMAQSLIACGVAKPRL